MKVRSHKVNVITMGCSKNLVDSELLMRQVQAQGIEVVHDSVDADADTVIINTCGFIQDAKQESIDTILEYVREKEEGRLSNLYVTGCLSERYKKDLAAEIPEVDQYFGVNDIQKIILELGGDFKKELLGERLLSTPSHYAYLKISEGCDRRCSFCAIPLIRGKQKSRTIEDLTGEARRLTEDGVREIIMIAQDLTAYGTDIYGKRELPELLRSLAAIRELPWIRLHYAYPAAFPDEILSIISEHGNICNYLDIPLQHISDPVLTAMHRGINRQESLDLIHRIRNEVPDVALRTTLLVGHPGEGEKEFRELLDFVQQARFERLGVFSYSEEEDTWGAKNLEDTLSEEEKITRVEELMHIQQSISLQINEKRIGKILPVMIDRREGDYYIGRTEYDSPEVDNEVIVRSGPELRPGTFVNVNIKEVREFDLFGYAVE